MTEYNQYDVIVIGGGLAGLMAAIRLARRDYSVLLFEKNSYPAHKVCGEYVSNEVLEVLKDVGLNPFDLGASDIRKLVISDVKGKVNQSALPLGGFGLSRFILDDELCKLAVKNGVTIHAECRVEDVQHVGNRYMIKTKVADYYSAFVIGAFGKRSTLDKKMDRQFIRKRTGFIGVKYHAKLDLPQDEIALHSFKNGYCGIVKIEANLYNICYLFNRKGKVFESISEIEKNYVFRNPELAKVFTENRIEEAVPFVINEIYFGKKDNVKNNVLFCGDAAGLITPLCGNGMSMAIHSAILLADCILSEDKLNPDVRKVQARYQNKWNTNFKWRLSVGRKLQHLFLNPGLNPFALKMIYSVPGLDKLVISQTHGRKIIAIAT